MSTKARETLHHLVDRLPDDRLRTAREVLQALGEAAGWPRSLLEAPVDDEPDNDDLDGGLTEARTEADAGKGIPHEEAMRQIGIG